MVQFHFETKIYLFSLLVRTLPFHGIGASSILARDVFVKRMFTFYELRTKFLNKFLIDGKKYNSFFILNNIFYFLNLKNKNNFKIFLHFFLTHINKVNIFSYFLSQEIYNSLFKTSYTYNLYKLQNENFLKLKNNSHYRWF